jgi:hypothetical protein
MRGPGGRFLSKEEREKYGDGGAFLLPFSLAPTQSRVVMAWGVGWALYCVADDSPAAAAAAADMPKDDNSSPNGAHSGSSPESPANYNQN